MSIINRRDFLKVAGTGVALGTSPLMSLAQVSASASALTDYRALVCIYLFGGNDSFNMLIPRSTAEYNAYGASRQNLAVPQENLLPVSPLEPDGVDYGFHPSMPELQNMFEQGHTAVVTNVGPLLKSVTKDQYLNNSVDLPPRLFSHNSQSDQWQTLQGLDASATGWAGRISDLVNQGVGMQRLPTNISLGGNQLMLAANSTIPYVIGPSGPAQFAGLDENPDLRQAYERLLAEQQEKSIYEQAFMEVQQRALQSVDKVRSAVANAQPVSVDFSDSPLGLQLQTVAQLISARDELQMKRQIFFVGMGGFDTHDNQISEQPALFAEISKSMSDFYQATQELGIAESVTTFTQSDFGRTLTSNGDGTDHGWGGNHLVMGGSVLGRRIYGKYPDLSMGGPDEVSGGRLIPTLSADQYVATLSKWFGVADANLDQITPNIGNFVARDLGFMV
jgi:uncharacterized protein (DUF1501 family)